MENYSSRQSRRDSFHFNHSPSASDFTVKPIVSKPMPNKKSTAPPPKPSSGAKRAAESDSNPKDSKKKKPANSGGEEEDNRKGRLWSEDDEIAIFKGMIDFKAKRGAAAFSNMEAFHEFVKEGLKAEVKTSQLMDKFRRLKKRYLTETDAAFSKPHEFKLFQLAKKIWGVEANGGDYSVKNSKKKPRKSAVKVAPNNASDTVLALPVSEERSVEKNVCVEMDFANGVVKEEEEEEDMDEFWSKYNSMRLGNCPSRSAGMEKLMMLKMPLIGSAKAKELDDKWRKLEDAEMVLFVKTMELAAKKFDLMHEQSQLIVDISMDISRKD